MKAAIHTTIPEHLAALQLLLNRCRRAEDRKCLVVDSAIHGAIAAHEAQLLLSANALETA